MENDIYKSPEAELETDTLEGEYELATRWSRLFAAIIDGITIIPITFLLVYLTGGFEGISEGQEPSLQYNIIMTIVSTTLFLLIHGKILLKDGQTWGKKVVNIKIVTTTDGHANLQTLAKRYGFYWGVPIIPIVGQLISFVNILFIFSRSKKCIHDHIGGTKVVQAK